jgi:hypothetical protein
MLFGPPPLFHGEDPKIYDQLLKEISTAVTPADIFEDIWVRDVVDLTIEVFRLRRLKVNLMMTNAYKGLTETLSPLVGRSQAETLAEGWAARKSDVVEEVNKTLTSAGLTTDSILAQTFSLIVNDIERIEHMMALAEARAKLAILKLLRGPPQFLTERLPMPVDFTAAEIGADRSMIIRLMVEHVLEHGSPEVVVRRSLLITGLLGRTGRRGRVADRIASAVVENLKDLAKAYLAARRGSQNKGPAR